MSNKNAIILIGFIYFGSMAILLLYKTIKYIYFCTKTDREIRELLKTVAIDFKTEPDRLAKVIIKTFCENHIEEKKKGNLKIVKRKDSTKKNQEKQSAKEPNWYPTGWYLDKSTNKWIKPDFKIIEETKEQELRKTKYYERRKSEGKEPTYEEWKAAREAEKHLDD